MSKADLLVIGARTGSLGEAIAKRADCSVATAGLDEEELILDVTKSADIRVVLRGVQPKMIVVTAGVNLGKAIGHPGFVTDMQKSFMVNTIGTMNVLNEWLLYEHTRPVRPQQFVAIGSNSAHIARRNSSAYCASKAALSMALRVAARECAGEPLVYGYELGLLKGTPMTKATERRFGPAQSRMVGAEEGLSVAAVAETIWQNLAHPFMGFNGAMLRLDAGEQ